MRTSALVPRGRGPAEGHRIEAELAVIPGAGPGDVEPDGDPLVQHHLDERLVLLWCTGRGSAPTRWPPPPTAPRGPRRSRPVPRGRHRAEPHPDQVGLSGGSDGGEVGRSLARDEGDHLVGRHLDLRSLVDTHALAPGLAWTGCSVGL